MPQIIKRFCRFSHLLKAKLVNCKVASFNLCPQNNQLAAVLLLTEPNREHLRFNSQAISATFQKFIFNNFLVNRLQGWTADKEATAKVNIKCYTVSVISFQLQLQFPL